MKSLKYSWLEISKGLPVVWGIKVQKSLNFFFLFLTVLVLDARYVLLKTLKG